jgi:hypothetical protein
VLRLMHCILGQPVLIEQKSRWTPESAWTLWKKEKFLPYRETKHTSPRSSSPQSSRYNACAIPATVYDKCLRKHKDSN